MLGVFERIIDERVRDDSSDRDDVLSTLLKLDKENKITLDDVKQMLVVSTSYYKFCKCLAVTKLCLFRIYMSLSFGKKKHPIR